MMQVMEPSLRVRSLKAKTTKNNTLNKSGGKTHEQCMGSEARNVWSYGYWNFAWNFG